MNEPWWIAGDRNTLAAMHNAIAGKAETDTVRYTGDQRPVMVSEVRNRIEKLNARINADIAKFIDVKGDYEKM